MSVGYHARILTILLTLASFTIHANCETSSQTNSVSQFGKISVGGPAPAFAMPAREGGVISLRKLLAKEQPVLLSFWASWCRPCKRGLPLIQKWVDKRQKHNDSVPQIVCVNYKDNPEQAAVIWAELDLELPYELDRYGAVFERFAGKDSASLPLTILLDKQGTIRLILNREGKDLGDILSATMDSLAQAPEPSQADSTKMSHSQNQ